MLGLAFQATAKPMHLDSIKVYIPFYGNFNDWSGWNNNAQSGNPDLGVDRYGNQNRAFAILDSTHFLTVPTTHTQVPTYTYMQWVRLDERPDSLGMTVFETGDVNCRHSLRLFPKGRDSITMRYQIPFGDADSVVEMHGRLPDNEWHHLTVLRSKDSVYLYLDVLFNKEFHVPGLICHAGDFVNYGANLDSGQMLHGAMDEIRIYSENIEPSLLLSIVQGERLGVENESSKLSISIFPNPSINSIHIISRTDFNAVEIYSLNGALLLSKSGILSKELTLIHQLPSGSYLIKLKNGITQIGSSLLEVN